MCCKLLNIPWIFAYYFAIPPDRVAYINDLYPGSIYKMPDNQNKISLKECGDIIKKFRNRKLTAFYAPLGSSFLNNIKCYSHNLIKRISNKVEYNPYAFPTVKERIIDLTCRFKNRVKYPYKYLLKDYPKSKYIFFTLHVYPEATIDVYAPIFNNQFALLDQISKSIPCTHKLIIKAHFVDPFTWERKNSGGKIAGQPGVDKIPAMLTEGEYVINANAARHIGEPTLNKINSGRFANGGIVSDEPKDRSSGSGADNTNNITITINVDNRVSYI